METLPGNGGEVVGRELVRRVLARVDVEDLTRRMTASIRAHPERGPFVRAEPEALEVHRWNIELFLRWLADDRPPRRSISTSFACSPASAPSRGCPPRW